MTGQTRTNSYQLSSKFELVQSWKLFDCSRASLSADDVLELMQIFSSGVSFKRLPTVDMGFQSAL